MGSISADSTAIRPADRFFCPIIAAASRSPKGQNSLGLRFASAIGYDLGEESRDLPELAGFSFSVVP
jgi:hypothetical protein